MATYKESLAQSEKVLKQVVTKKDWRKDCKNKSYSNRTKSRDSGLKRLKLELEKNKKAIENSEKYSKMEKPNCWKMERYVQVIFENYK